MMALGRPKALARWISWFFGLGFLFGVVMFSTHYSQEMGFAQLLLHARPAWLLVALLLQMGTYLTDAPICWREGTKPCAIPASFELQNASGVLHETN